jgi:hypothetical protein
MLRTREIGFDHNGIGTVLEHNRLAVPVNQREYSWEHEHVDDLLKDFGNAINGNKNTYFLGTIVLTASPQSDIPEVADGQQRLATTMILLAGIRDYFHAQGDKQRSTGIEQQYLVKTDLATTNIVPRLRLNVDDNEFFTKQILSPPDSDSRGIKPSKLSHKRILHAQELVAQHIAQILEPHKPNNRAPRLLEWITFIAEAAQVIVLRVPDHLNAFMMFETLNDRGLRASQADLLKNHLLSYAGDRIKEGQQRWAQMRGTLEGVRPDHDITVTFLHHLLISKHGPMRERDVFDRVRQTVNNQNRAIEFLDEMADAAKDYAALLNPDSTKWNEYGTSTRNHLRTIIRDLRVEQIRPLMFAVARKFGTKEAQNAFKLFVYWSVRFLFVGGRGGVLDKLWGTRAHDVESGKVKTAKELVAAMGDSVPSDLLFETHFADARVSATHLARYYLRALELQVKEEKEPSYVPNDEETAINLEHILPESPQKGWSHLDEETATAYYKKIGNLVLLQAKANTDAGNGPFAEKKKILGASGFVLTREVAESKTWGVDEIKARQKRLAVLAVKTWPMGVS